MTDPTRDRAQDVIDSALARANLPYGITLLLARHILDALADAGLVVVPEAAEPEDAR